MRNDATAIKKSHEGRLPKWRYDELPEPLAFSLKNAFRTIGPGAILLATSIGGGEWLVGPAMAVQFGTGIFWIATMAIVLQLLLNLEGIRYTLYSGEPILTGFMRLRPGSGFWSITYIILAGAQLGMPALAAGCSSVLFSVFFTRLPGPADAATLVWITYGVMAVTVAILLFGGTIERMLEYASWVMIVYIFAFLVTVNIVFVPLSHWGTTFLGFFEFGYIPAGTDLMLLATLAATAGSGGIGNLVISNWVRDKGMGMGAKVGAIASAFGPRQVKLSHVGKIFPVNAENLRRWRLWWKYAEVDQVWLWGVGCFVGMFLNVNLATAIIPHGTDIARVGAGAFQAQYMAEHLWAGFWYLALLNGFWVLFSTHLGNTDTLVRSVTDIIWVSSRKARASKSGNVSRVYYGLLIGFTLWGLFAVNWGTAMTLFKILGVVAGVVLCLSSIQIYVVNTTLLPPQLQPARWRRAALVLCALFYGVLSVVVLLEQF